MGWERVHAFAHEAEMWLSLIVNTYLVFVGVRYVWARIFRPSETLKDAAMATLFLFPGLILAPILVIGVYLQVPEGYEGQAVTWSLVALLFANLIYLYSLGKK